MIGQSVPNTLPVTLNLTASDADLVLRAIGQMPHNTVRNLYDSIASQLSQQVSAHVAASNALASGVAPTDATVAA